nr:immunoglobulin heavy chain junction region [Mus musculus]
CARLTTVVATPFAYW